MASAGANAKVPDSPLTEWFGLSAGDAGMRTAGFTMTATALRPVGGWLEVLRAVLPLVAVCALLMSLPHLLPFGLVNGPRILPALGGNSHRFRGRGR